MASQHDAQQYDEYFKTRKPAAAANGMIQAWHGRMLRMLGNHIPELDGRHLLEVGAGWGYFARACKERGVAYSGIELNGAQAASLCTEGFDVVSAAIPPFPPGPPVSVIYMSHVLEHATTYTHALAMLEATRDRLSTEGYVAVICPDLLSWKEEFWGGDWSHGFPTTLRRLRQIVAEAGFEIVDARHHTAGLAQPAAVFAATQLMRLIPVRIIDLVAEALTQRTLAYSFMTVFGWRQLLVIGRKRR